MEEKRNFYDYWHGKAMLPMISFFIIGLISGIVVYNTLLSKYNNELDAYSESTYQYLEEIADIVVQEGVGIDLLKLPDDVIRYNITTTTENNEIVEFKYYLDDNKDMQFAEPSGMTVELSKDRFKIISKIPNCSSKEDYIWKIKLQMIIISTTIGLVLGMIAVVTGDILASFSKRKKEKNFFIR